jgi:ferric-dicitrate binding protein FerR (iron transport regulator)
VIPLLQKVLPLLDGNVALALTNLVAPRLQAPTVDLQPMESTLAKVRAELMELRAAVATHDSALERIEQQVELVKDSLERSAATQEEIVEDFEHLRKRMTVLAVIGFLLLMLSVAANVLIIMRFGRILP